MPGLGELIKNALMGGIKKQNQGPGIPQTPMAQPQQPQQPDFYKKNLKGFEESYGKQVKAFDIYKNLDNPDLAKEITPNFVKNLIIKTLGGVPQEILDTFQKDYSEDPEYSKAIDKLYQNMIALENDLPAREQAEERKAYSDWLLNLAKGGQNV